MGARQQKKLTREEEYALIAVAQQVKADGRPTKRASRAQGELFVRWTPWINTLVAPYVRRGLARDDAWQEAARGFLHALRKFDMKRGFRLSTYATAWVKAYVRNSLVKASLISFSTTQEDRSLFWVIGRIEAEVSSRGGPDADIVKQLAKRLPGNGRGDLDRARAFLLKWRTARFPLPLDVRMPGYEETYLVLLREPGEGVEDQLVAGERLALLRRALAALDGKLTDRERAIIAKRITAPDGKQKTLRALAEEFGVSRERIRQIEVALIGRLRREYRRCEGDVCD